MSVLRRARALSSVGHTVEILVDTFSPEFEDQVRLLTADGGLNSGRITIRSMFYDLGGMTIPEAPEAYSSPLGRVDDGWEYSRDLKRPDIWRGKQDGQYKHFVWMRGAKVNGIDLLVDGKRARRTWYNFYGQPCKIEHMDEENKPHRIEYLNSAGNIYLQENINATGAIQSIVLHTRDGIRNFPTRSALAHYWLHDIVFANEVGPTIISEYGFHRKSLQELELHKGATVIFTIHNNHFAAPYQPGAPIRSEQRDFFAHLKDYKAVVLLTDEQRGDITEQFGEAGNLHVIPHHMPAMATLPDANRDPNRIVMIGRFDAVKGHDRAIEAFAKVLASHPSATLDLYGRGVEEGKLRLMVEDLGLSESIRFRGFTANAFQEFSEAGISIVASSYEGFCLSLAESMAAGCVPVTMGFKYGPADLVTSGHDGIIVPSGDIDQLAHAISELLSDPERLKAMSKYARQISDRLSEARLIDAWQHLLAGLAD